MKEIIIKKNDAEQRIDKFLAKSFPNLPQALIYKYIRKKYIKINEKRCQISTKLSVGDVLSLYIKDEFFERNKNKYDFLKAPGKSDILFEDENILLLNKEAGLLVYPDKTNYQDSLIARVKKYLYEKGEYLPEMENSFSPALINRIDRNTCGIVVAAKNAETLRILNEKMKNREIKKFYLCLVCGYISQKSGILSGFLEKNHEQNRVYITSHSNTFSKKIKTKYKVIAEWQNLSLLEVELLTGRTHQIRAHLAFIGHPIVGDSKYGKSLQNKNTRCKWQALCSYKVIFKFEGSAGILNYLNGKEFKVDHVAFLKNLINPLA
ncbi:MAG: RluA family pseudouridine synthase [Oscillospiraceae bacterium]|nr:RluA family pseudouridine synthase [Oscillospiraceae bacterium]